jgi:hypothetical protein
MTASVCSPNGFGCRFSLFGLLGLTAAKDEGLETKILELSDGADFSTLPSNSRVWDISDWLGAHQK